MRPIALGPNQPARFYRGGGRISALRGTPGDAPSAAEERLPEDWVGSTTTVFGEATAGLTMLPDGRTLRDALRTDPEAYLGPAHTRTFGTDPALLVKLLDAAERLPVHSHPDRAFARAHLDCAFGKTEAWIVVQADGPDPAVYLGFAEPVPRTELDTWVRNQDDRMLGALNKIQVRPGDAIFVPAGVPHAIGAGVFIVELQEPTDFSVLLEWRGFPLDGPRQGHLGLGYATALDCVDRTAWTPSRLRELRTPPAETTRLLPRTADPFFRAERITGPASREPGFAILVVVGGEGSLVTGAGDKVRLRRGSTVLVPYGAGSVEVHGDCEAIVCRPPAAKREA